MRIFYHKLFSVLISTEPRAHCSNDKIFKRRIWVPVGSQFIYFLCLTCPPPSFFFATRNFHARQLADLLDRWLRHIAAGTGRRAAANCLIESKAERRVDEHSEKLFRIPLAGWLISASSRMAKCAMCEGTWSSDGAAQPKIDLNVPNPHYLISQVRPLNAQQHTTWSYQSLFLWWPREPKLHDTHITTERL